MQLFADRMNDRTMRQNTSTRCSLGHCRIGRETIYKVVANLRYSDAFGEIRKSFQCKSFLWIPSMQNSIGGNIAVQGFIDCDQLDAAFGRYEAYKQQQPNSPAPN